MHIYYGIRESLPLMASLTVFNYLFVRNVAMGTSSAASYIGQFCSPYIIFLVSDSRDTDLVNVNFPNEYVLNF